MFLHEIWKKEKNRTFKHVWTIKNNRVLSRLEFQVGLRALNQSTLKCSKYYLNFGFCPTYLHGLFGTTRKYTLLIKFHNLFPAHTFMWYFGAQLCRLIKNGLQKNKVSQKLELSNKS